MKICSGAVAALAASTLVAAQTPPGVANPLARHYRDGETLTYHMTGINEQWHYTADATAVVEKDAHDRNIEEFRWISMSSDAQAIRMEPSMEQFREVLSLDPARPPSTPDLGSVDPRFVGPITDLMTFYVDLWLANRVATLRHDGDHFYLPNPHAGSWADGTHVLTGECQVDFDLKLESIDPLKKIALLVVRHLPPPHPHLQFPAAWMEIPVAGTPNNWIEVSKTKDGKFEAGAGKETFDDRITVSTVDGRILSATMDDSVIVTERPCGDAAPARCGKAHSRTIHRRIAIALEP
jgi:hypothetical protein